MTEKKTPGGYQPEAAPGRPRPPASSSSAVARPARPSVAMGDRGILVASLDEALRLADIMARSGCVPPGTSTGAVMYQMEAGLQKGLGALGGIQQTTVINNQLSWKGQAAFALIQNSPLCKPGTLMAWVEGEGEDRKGVCSGWRVGYAEPFRSEFSMRDAKRAGLLEPVRNKPDYKTVWMKYPDRQLKWRAVGYFAKDFFSDVLGGFPIAEEVADYDERPPARAVLTAAGPPKASPSGPDPVLEELEKKAATLEPVEAEIVEPDQAVENGAEAIPEDATTTGPPIPAEVLDVQTVNGTDSELEAAAATASAYFKAGEVGPATGELLEELKAELVEPPGPVEAAELRRDKSTTEALEDAGRPESPPMPEDSDAPPSVLRSKLGINEAPVPPPGRELKAELLPEAQDAGGDDDRIAPDPPRGMTLDLLAGLRRRQERKELRENVKAVRDKTADLRKSRAELEELERKAHLEADAELENDEKGRGKN